MKQIFTVLFDLDGTLIDTAPDLMRAHNHVMSKFGYPTKSTDEITDTLDMGMVKFALGGVGNYNKLVYDVTEHTMRALPVKHFEEFLTLGVKNYELKDKMLNRFHQLISLAVENMFENLGDPDDSHAHNERLREIERGQ